jgi:FtsP/CotA-like multicopper oxidase with cupredoxin domain
MFIVHLGDVVQIRIVNDTTLSHPMRLHGHHALAVSRNGAPSTGAPWWIDSLGVDPRDRNELILVADNPGVWMFHCHNLPHARAGLMPHLMYDNVHTPQRIGRINPRLVNNPE